MQLQFLGDALDHWKGALFQHLFCENLLKELYVEPMITDNRVWTPKELNTYVKLLHLKNVDRIIHLDRIFTGNRVDYFNSIEYLGDLFLDPDTGIATGNATRRLIKVIELDLIMKNNPDRVLSIYQHTRQGIKMSGRVTEVTNCLFKNLKDISCTSYEGTMVAMLFISRNKKRIGHIYDYFHELIEPVAERRLKNFI